MATTIKEIKDIIDVGHIFLLYHGDEIFIDPRTNLDTGKMQFWLGYKDLDLVFDSENELFDAKVLDGHSLREVCGELEID